MTFLQAPELHLDKHAQRECSFLNWPESAKSILQGATL
uniref:Uncharacterized protein n=1 Tax=Arundo donax TaxID=35708 RepID=A0A0A9GA56_ARUDO